MKMYLILKLIILIVFCQTLNAADPSLNIYIPGTINGTTISSLRDARDFLVDNFSTYFYTYTYRAKQPINIILTDDISVADYPADHPESWYELWWNLSGTAAHPITIKSEDGYKHAINRYSRNSELNNLLILLRNGYSSTARIEHIYFKNIIFHDASSCLGFIMSRYCRVENCEFIVNEFVPKGGGGVINLTTWDPDSIPPVNSSSYNIITGNKFDFKDESVLDIHFRDEDHSMKWKSFYLYHGVYLAHCDNNTISYNQFYNAPGGCIHAYHNYTKYNDILHNYIYMCYTHDYKIRSPKLDLVNPPFAPHVGSTGNVDERRWGIIIWDENSTSVGNNIVSNELHASNANPDTFGYSPLNPPDNIFIIRQNLVSVTEWDSNTHYTDYYHCDHDEDAYLVRYNSRYNSDDIKVYNFVSGQLFVVDEKIGRILKIDGYGGTDTCMFSGDNVLGSQEFNKVITAMVYINGYTFIGFNDGKILKIQGTGGNGTNMFAVEETQYGFSTVPGYNYYVGCHKFDHGIRHIKYISGYTFISFEDGKLLKINGAGGSGTNLFAIQETDDGFSSLPGYNYYYGHAKFNGVITYISYINGKSFWAFDNTDETEWGKILKINGVGGSGSNMFAVNESTYGFSSVEGYNYYAGHDKFDYGYVTNITNLGAQTIFCLSDGKILKIQGNNGTGDLGSDMFAVNETEDGFTGMQGYSYYVGHHKYSGYVTDAVSYEGKHFLSFHDGKLRRISDILDCSGADMFDGYKDGWNTFFASVTDLEVIGNYLFISLMHGRIIKIEGEGFCYSDIPVVYNMFNIVEKPYKYVAIDGHYKYDIAIDTFDTSVWETTKYLKGSDNINESQNPFYKMRDKEFQKNVSQYSIMNYPNPFNPSTNISISLPKSEKVTLEIYNTLGQKIKTILNKEMPVGTHIVEFDGSTLPSGIYFYKIKAGDYNDVKKMVLLR